MTDRAVTGRQKEEIISYLLELWEFQPQLRLGQLLASAFPGSAGSLIGMEDWPLINCLRAAYGLRAVRPSREEETE